IGLLAQTPAAPVRSSPARRLAGSAAGGGAAVTAELRAGGELGAAPGAEGLGRGGADRLAAAGAELLARLDPRLAVRARADHGRGRIDAGDVIDLAHLVG